MFGSVILEVILGLAFIYAWFSLACAAIVEYLESFRAQRGKLLAIAIERMLGAELKQQFYAHGLIRSLAKPGRLPSYIPAHNFALVVLDLLGVDAAQFRQQLDATAGDLGKTMRALMQGDTDYAGLVERLESWFDSTMERCSGWYRRRARSAAFVTGLVVASCLNIDSLEIASTIYSDTHLRLSMMAQTETEGQVPVGRRTADNVPSVMNIPAESGILPLGWENSRLTSKSPWADNGWNHAAFWFGPVLAKLFGLIVSGLAASLGAAFWFERLRRWREGRACHSPARRLSSM